MALLTLAGVLLFVQLGRWQLHRAAEKRVLQAAFDAGALQISDLGARALAATSRCASGVTTSQSISSCSTT
jgi:hypothetical protein